MTAEAIAPGQQRARHHLWWETALDRLELEVIFAERLLADPTREHDALEPWDEPELSGPIPQDLVDRAVSIRLRQERAERALAEAAGLARRQHDFATRVDRATGRHVRPAVYLDLQA